MREKNKELYEKYWEKVRNLKPVIEYGKSIFPSDKKATVKSLNFMVNNLKQGVKNLEEHKNKK